MVTFLTGMHLRELRFLEVSCHPEVGERNDGQEILPDAEVRANLDVLFVDDAGGGGGDVGVAEVELSLIDFGLCLFDVRHGSVGLRLLGADLVGASS